MLLIDDEKYKYIAIGFGTISLIPQIIHGYRNKSMKDVSTLSLICFFTSSMLWCYYMYDNNYRLYMYITGFFCVTVVLLIVLQFYQYYVRFKEHVKHFESKAKTSLIKDQTSQNIIHLSTQQKLPKHTNNMTPKEDEFEVFVCEENY